MRWKEIKTRLTRSLGLTGPRSALKIAKGEAGIWQRRFWAHHIRDGHDFTTHLQYCWWTPVKHGFAERPNSSIHRDIRLGQVQPEWAGIGMMEDFGEQGG